MLLQPFRWCFWALARVVLSLRYRVKVIGLDAAKAKPGPYLVLPNHVGFTDPPNIFTLLWPHFRFRPVLFEGNFKNPVMAPLAWLVRAIKVPDTDRASAESQKRAQEAVANIVAALKAGENVVLWPSGRLTRDGIERIGGARAAADILAAVPAATAVLVRTRGLWGSRFTWAPFGPLQPIVRMLLGGLGTILSNLGVFTPRRRMTQTLQAFTAGERPDATKEAVNKWLERWYNADLPQPEEKPGDEMKPGAHLPTEGEKPTFVPYHFALGPRTFDYPPPHAEPGLDVSGVPEEAKRGVTEIVSDKLKRPLTDTENKPETAFLELGIDSLDAMEIALQVEQRFGFSGAAVPTTLGQLWALAGGTAESGPAKPAPPAWSAEPSDTGPLHILGETAGEAFANRCAAHPRDVAAADDLAGVLTYERLYAAGRGMADHFRTYPEPNVGLLLPASVGGDLALVALHWAGKLPVVLNWTTGPVNLEHAVKLTGLKRVVTSRAFIDRTRIEVPGAEFVFLEDVRKELGKLTLLKHLLHVRLFPKSAARAAAAHARRDPHQPMVVLFTSGSEKAPKAVPLTHANVIANIRSAIPLFRLSRNDSVLGFLPVFHSFGHSITTLLPLLTGMKLVHHPDPTDAGGLARKIAAYKPTLMAGTPTFVSHILDRAGPGDLDSLLMVVVGAEKCPDAVFDNAKAKAPNATIVEGYGITECAPIVSANPIDRTKRGTIGRPLDGVEVRVTDPDTGAPLPPGQRGLLLVSGPNVFPGYLGHEGESPFVEADGQRWYRTGDLAAVDPDGYLMFHGRMKRFLKAGGEMISLPALEEPFARQYPPTDAGPRVAVEGVETSTGRKVVLFTTEPLTVKDANATLQGEGFRGVMRLDEVRKVDAIPVLGTGKTDYKVLRAQIEQEG